MRRTHALALAALGLTALVAALALPAVGANGNGAKLTKEEKALLAQARSEGKSSIIVMVAAKGGAAQDAIRELESLGATVQYRDAALGYIRASIAIDRVEEAARLASVEALDVDETVPLPDPRPEGVLGIIAQPAPGAGTPRVNPYMPTQDTGAAQFVNAHPTWDGRGVTIGIVDTGVSLDHPSLLTTSTGQPKVIDWVTGTDPVTDNDPTWINMENQVSGSSFVFQGATYIAPAAGSYRIGLFNERDSRLGGEIGTDVNRDGNPAGSSGIFAILWDPAADTVWVDTNQNGSFADQSAMRNYKVNRDIGWFGTDNPATAVTERLPFVVQTEGDIKYVNIGIVSGQHGSHVTGIAAGNALFGGQMSGAAPGAQIVSSRACLFIAGCTAHALTEGMIFVAKQSNVDVINMSIGGLPALNDGNNARCVVYKRLIEQSNVQMFISIGNSGPGVNTAGDPGVCDGVLGVGAYITDDTYLADYGAQLYEQDNLHYFSSRGPREDGGFDPDIVAPGAAISTTPLWQPGGGLASTLPPGYSLLNGTSMAAPQSAGVGALLVSAANANGAQKQPAQIREALMSSGRYLDPSRFQAYDQGVGLIDVDAAWNLLRTNLKPVDISSSVEVNTILSDFLATPGIGKGIYDREDVSVGQSYTRTYTFRRNDGPGGATTYNLTWVGNDGTFSTAGSINLPKGTPVNLNVAVNPTTAGAHSAILRLNDPSTPGIEYQTMNTVIATAPFNAANNYSQTVSGNLGPGQAKHYFFDVPAGTPAFKVDLVGGGPAGAGAIRFIRWHPWGLGIDSNAVSNCYNGAPGGCTTGSPTSRTVSNPQAGVWEVSVDARRNSDAVSAPFSLTATLLGASVSPNPDVIASATIGVPVARSYSLTNLFGAFTGRAVGTNLGSAFRSTPTIANLQQQTFDVTVAAGSTSLRATIGSPSDPAADLDLFVFNCTTGTCVLAGQNADGDSEESVTIANPAAGLWRVLVDGFAVPSGSTTYNYVDVFANPAFGSVSVTDANALRPAGSSWTVPGSVTANAAPAAGRVLLGNVEVRTDTNVLVGSGDVIVQSVTP
jgi:subtilisin family serine protease